MCPIALYYPWRRFQDDDWVKLALLAWDKIARAAESYGQRAVSASL
jgi:hypothetical protein